MEVSALYVEKNGAYSELAGVEAWDIKKDARNYSGTNPVVAHPPCNLWCKMTIVNYTRWGGDHNMPGNDGGCFFHALWAVRTFGGVLEHPRSSKAWEFFGLARPIKNQWTKTKCGGWVCEVWQSAYGHLANKATWLYYTGGSKPKELRWDRVKGTHQVGFYDQRGKIKNKKTISGKRASETPLLFRDELVRLAKSSTV